jgi:hypothetical protein
MNLAAVQAQKASCFFEEKTITSRFSVNPQFTIHHEIAFCWDPTKSVVLPHHVFAKGEPHGSIRFPESL